MGDSGYIVARPQEFSESTSLASSLGRILSGLMKKNHLGPLGSPIVLGEERCRMLSVLTTGKITKDEIVYRPHHWIDRFYPGCFEEAVVLHRLGKVILASAEINPEIKKKTALLTSDKTGSNFKNCFRTFVTPTI
ncbi:hypothetical protein AVEN_134255-1 [Araneus ventricosus]|uniref:Uncharacterized protein n=1 Tax=Araneus ventricosus TaxID=182803 RepID=A0A4Y2M9M6_ARAVE|nr:hypothetical protein AVEN_134255-1 [Araneus ventricosus]